MVVSSRDKVGVRESCRHDQGCVQGARHTQVISLLLSSSPKRGLSVAHIDRAGNLRFQKVSASFLYKELEV